MEESVSLPSLEFNLIVGGEENVCYVLSLKKKVQTTYMLQEVILKIKFSVLKNTLLRVNRAVTLTQVRSSWG